MPYSSLHDPVDVARAYAAVDHAWQEIVRRRLVVAGDDEAERIRLGYIVVGLFPVAANEHELVQRAIAKFHSDEATKKRS
ncbi:hypothetical protein J2X48_005249 [Bosea sp. BE271]|jgi:hypothetical protein|uniref:hypothetical protein n=1 Tax=Bosea TaxID=85413 RepID=UPI00285E5675|nr:MULTISPECIES: hypothetical protein [Bosea]MDR6831567.1 hypothetical protein [Bosea robiniae]MDR6898276.1 hypothetical protein [Bosea sp. BE109]MDR7141681.1 hypothetical protein [Bosea sp. BE168]MDR7178296.1 hypothetical protein [Bosea sp. BE271]